MQTKVILRNLMQVGLLVVLFLVSQEAMSQCSVCRVSAEGSDSKLVLGLNSGILYLMGIPYLLLMGLGVVLFRRARTMQQ